MQNTLNTVFCNVSCDYIVPGPLKPVSLNYSWFFLQMEITLVFCMKTWDTVSANCNILRCFGPGKNMLRTSLSQMVFLHHV